MNNPIPERFAFAFAVKYFLENIDETFKKVWDSNIFKVGKDPTGDSNAVGLRNWGVVTLSEYQELEC